MVLSLLTGCPDKGGESASGSETNTTSGAPTTGEAMTTTATTTAATTEASATSDASTAEPTTAGPTTGATTGEPLCDLEKTDFEASCASLCEVFGGCDPEVDPAACATSCGQDRLVKDTPACLCSATAWNDCRAALDCDGLASVDLHSDTPCFIEGANYLVRCGDCLVAPDFIAPDQCTTLVECPDVLGVSFVCSGGTCRCHDGEQEFASCPDRGLCAGQDAAALNAAASECCGVDF